MTGPWTPLTEDEQLDSALRLANSGNHPTEPQLGGLKRALLREHARANALQAECDEARRLLAEMDLVVATLRPACGFVEVNHAAMDRHRARQRLAETEGK